MTKNLLFAVFTIAALSLVVITPVGAQSNERTVELSVGPLPHMCHARGVVLQLCYDLLDEECLNLPVNRFGCEDGLLAEPLLDPVSVNYWTDNLRKPEPGAFYEADLYCSGLCAAICDEPPELEALFCVASTEEYCNNVCPRLFRDENGRTAGECFEIPNGGRDGSNCWGCRNKNDPSEVWSPADQALGGGGKPTGAPFNQVESPYGGGGGGGGSGGGHCRMVCIEYQNGFSGYLDCTYICD